MSILHSDPFGIEIYKYYQSYGTKGNAYAYKGSSYLPTVVSDSTREAYDIVNLYFKDDIFIKWDGYIQR